MKYRLTIWACALAVTILLFLLIYKSPSVNGGNSRAAKPTHILDGTVILLRNGITNAAVVITKQSMNPEVVDYTWYFRSDGKTTFGTNDPHVQTGSVKGGAGIVFGSFDVQWSIAGYESGWIYYPLRYRSFRMPWGKYVGFDLPYGPTMAVTTERDITKLDMDDSRWRFMHASVK